MGPETRRHRHLPLPNRYFYNTTPMHHSHRMNSYGLTLAPSKRRRFDMRLRHCGPPHVG